MNRRFGFQTDNEIRHVVVHLSVVQVGNGEAEAGVLDHGVGGWMLVDKARGGLFPPLSVRDNVIHVTVQDLARLAACPEIDFRGRTWPGAGFVSRDFGRLALRCVGADRFRENLYQPAVVGSQKQVLDVSGGGRGPFPLYSAARF